MTFKPEILEKMYETNCLEIAKILIEANLKNERMILRSIAQFLNNKTKIKIDGNNTDHNELNVKIGVILVAFSQRNSLEEVSLENLPNTRIIIPTCISPTIFKSINAPIGDLSLDTTKITTLILCNNSEIDLITGMVEECENLKNLYIKSPSTDELIFDRLHHMKLDSFKLTGQSTSKLNKFTDLKQFLKSQAPHLKKLTLKIKNRPDIPYNIINNETVFVQLKKVKYLTSKEFSSLLIPKPFCNVNSFKIKSDLLSKQNCLDILAQLNKNKNLKTLTFINNEYSFSTQSMVETLYNFCNKNKVTAINFRQTTHN